MRFVLGLGVLLLDLLLDFDFDVFREEERFDFFFCANFFFLDFFLADFFFLSFTILIGR